MSNVPLNALDQAGALRSITSPQPVQVIAVTAGKGGVGKTNVSVNLALALRKQQKNVLLLDADLALANVDIMLGLQAKKTLSDVMNGTCTLEETLLEGPMGLKIIPAASGTEMMANLSQQEHIGLIHAFSDLANQLDTLIIDTAAGISDSVTVFGRAAHEILIVLCDEPTSISDAYALIKILSQAHGCQRFRVLTNMVKNTYEGIALFRKLLRVTDQFLDVILDHVGNVPFDDHLRQAVKQQRAVIELFPSAKASTAISNLAEKISSWRVPKQTSGDLNFFLERLVHNHDG